MKKLGFYAIALAFCVMLVGVAAMSSPVEAQEVSTTTLPGPSVNIYCKGGIQGGELQTGHFHFYDADE